MNECIDVPTWSVPNWGRREPPAVEQNRVDFDADVPTWPVPNWRRREQNKKMNECIGGNNGTKVNKKRNKIRTTK